MTSTTAVHAIFIPLMNAQVRVTLNFLDNHRGSAVYNKETSVMTINWDPTSGLVVGHPQSRSMQVQSAALTLAHEMGHIIQYIEGRQFTHTNAANEADVLARFETPIARELGEPTRLRYLHTASSVRTGGTTEWGTVSASWVRWNFNTGRNWDVQGRFTNQNTWTPN